MPQGLSASAARVQAALEARGRSLVVREMPASTRSAADAAAAIGCEVNQIVKSLVFAGRSSGEPVLLLVGGANRVDESRAAAVLGEGIGRASPEYVREHTGFAIGGVPPLGHSRPLRTLIDRDLMAGGELWAAAGTPNAVFRLTPDDLAALTGGQVADLKEER